MDSENNYNPDDMDNVISSPSNSEDIDSSISNNQNIESEIDSEIDDTDDGKFSTLQEKINQLKDNETLYLNNDYLDNDLENGITISKNIIIEGNGYKIDAASKSRIFNIINATSIKLNNIVFMNGYSKDNGGAIYFDKLSNSTFTNLSFINNHADNHGGAIYVDSEASINQFLNITLKNNTALRGAGIYIAEEVFNNTFDFYASQNSIQNFSGAVIFVGSDFKNNIFNGTYIDNHADDHCAGVLYIKGNITNNIFDGYYENNTAHAQTGGVFTLMGDVVNNTFKGKFYNNSANIGGVIYFNSKASLNQFINITLINNTALRGAGMYFAEEVLNNTFDLNASKNSIRNFSGAVICVGSNFKNNVFNGTYIDNHADDHCAGVLYVKCDITNNIFDGYYENNTGKAQTGGVFTLIGTAVNNTFKGKFYNNSARIGGALYFYLASYNNTIMAEFINNTATKSGSAIYFRGSPSNYILNSTFIDNKAASMDLNISFTDTSTKIIFIGGNNVINGFDAADIVNLTFENVTYWGVDSLINTDDFPPVFGPEASGQKITVEIYKNSQLIHKIDNITNLNGTTIINYPKLADGTYSYTIYHEDNSYYTYINKSGKFIIGQIATKLTLSNKKTTYNTGKYPIITLKDINNKILKHMKITVIINGKKTTKTTDNKGQVKLTGLVPKTYRITIKFNGNEKYFNSTLSTKISVLKANSKIVAKNSVYKRTAKHKRYSVLLKDNKNKAIKNTKISLIINKKTITAKTNSKGLATFKLDKFTKKGTFRCLIKFAGNNCFKASNKKTYIRFI